MWTTWGTVCISLCLHWNPGILEMICVSRHYWSILRFPLLRGLDWLIMTAVWSQPVPCSGIFWIPRKTPWSIWIKLSRILQTAIWSSTVLREETWNWWRRCGKNRNVVPFCGCWIRRKQLWVPVCCETLWNSRWLMRMRSTNGWMRWRNWICRRCFARRSVNTWIRYTIWNVWSAGSVIDLRIRETCWHLKVLWRWSRILKICWRILPVRCWFASTNRWTVWKICIPCWKHRSPKIRRWQSKRAELSGKVITSR